MVNKQVKISGGGGTNLSTLNNIQRASIDMKSLNDKIQNLSNDSGSNYFRIGSLLIQWGTLSGLKSNTTIYQNFPKSFKDTNYAIVFQKTAADHSNNTPMKASAKETGRFGVYSYGVSKVDWIAIGY